MAEQKPGSYLPDVVRFLLSAAPGSTLMALGAIAAAATMQAGVLVSALWGLIRQESSGTSPFLITGWFIILLFSSVIKLVGLDTLARLSANTTADLRKSLAERLSLTELPALEAVGRVRVKTAFSVDAHSIARATTSLALAANSVFLLGAAMIFAATINFEIVTIVFAFHVCIMFILHQMQKDIDVMSDRVAGIQDRFLDRADALFLAARDLRVDQRRATDYWNTGLASIIVGLRRGQRLIDKAVTVRVLFNDASFDIVVILLVFLLPLYYGWESTLVCVYIMFFAYERLIAYIVSSNALAYGNLALERFRRLEEALPKAGMPITKVHADDAVANFEELRLEDVTFSYERKGNEESAFTVGPLDLTIRRGRIYFIQGGNGAGKSTILKVLCGFYTPSTGAVRLNGIVQTALQYRLLYSIILTDFHLFERLYQLEPGKEDLAREWLRRLQLDGIVTLDGDRFSTTALSTGQRKRLAMVAAILQNRPLLVLDEWTADQDPEFRKVFFTRLLPLLRSRGITIIAVTHDDRYFQYCDSMIKVADGMIDSIHHNDFRQANVKEHDVWRDLASTRHIDYVL